MSDPTQPVSSTYELYPPVETFEEPVSRQRYWLHGLLLIGTLLTMLMTGARMNQNFLTGLPTLLGGDPRFRILALWIYHNPAELLNGIPFALTLIFILLCHEMGHYLYCLYYGVDATLPFFIPFPSPIGTLGAFIRIRSGIKSRSALFDIGIAGPIAGFVASLLVLACTLPLSRPMPPDAGTPELGLPLVFNLMYGVLGMLGIGTPAKLALQSVSLHPAAIAAWVGMFATSLNLLPGGQLDGGHIVYALAPRGHKWVSRLSIAGLVLMMYFWFGWGVWAILLRVSGTRHPQVAPWPDISRTRRWMALVALVLLVLTFVPQPFRTDPGDFPMGIGDYIRGLHAR